MATKLLWKTGHKDRKAYKSLIDKYHKHPLVLHRIEKNIKRRHIKVSKQSFWSALVGCLITTQQRSGPGSPTQNFLQSDHELLCFSQCRKQKRLKHFAQQALQNAGLRRYSMIAEQLTLAHEQLDNGEWKDIKPLLRKIAASPNKETERKTAKELQNRYKGLGPKQSRNLIQWMGLSQFEIPIDSRVSKVLRNLNFPLPLKPKLLGDEEYYALVLDGLQSILNDIDILPCVFDAAAFASLQQNT